MDLKRIKRVGQGGGGGLVLGCWNEDWDEDRSFVSYGADSPGFLLKRL